MEKCSDQPGEVGGVQTRSGESGLALLLVTILGVVLMSSWAIAWRGTNDTIRVERILKLRESRNEGVSVALYDAVDLLRSGAPATDPCECLVTVTVGGRVVSFKAVYSSMTPLDWDVVVTKATAGEKLLLPDLPASF
ncbi:MAG: hypothetical protein ACI9EF_000193 [Pseudohongiellaceae bacterium]